MDKQKKIQNELRERRRQFSIDPSILKNLNSSKNNKKGALSNGKNKKTIEVNKYEDSKTFRTTKRYKTFFENN